MKSQNVKLFQHSQNILHKQRSCELSLSDLGSAGQKTLYSVIASGTKEQLNRSVLQLEGV